MSGSASSTSRGPSPRVWVGGPGARGRGPAGGPAAAAPRTPAPFAADCLATPPGYNARSVRGVPAPRTVVDKEQGMAEERIGAPESEARTYWAWTELFRTFQVALDPKKLLLAAAGILVMYFGWWVLALIFFHSRAEPQQGDYDESRLVKDNPNLTVEEAKQRAETQYRID